MPISDDSSESATKRRILNLAGLVDLEKGFNKQQIRIWFAYSGPVEDLFIFSQTNSEWTGSLNKLEFQYDTTNGELVSIKRDSKVITPKSGWKPFIDSLTKIGLYDLPDMSAIPGYELERDGRWITVEFANCKIYRLYRYQSPWAYEKKFWQANRIMQLSRLIENQFNFPQPNKYLEHQ